MFVRVYVWVPEGTHTHIDTTRTTTGTMAMSMRMVEDGKEQSGIDHRESRLFTLCAEVERTLETLVR